jgi:hypothetical protein
MRTTSMRHRSRVRAGLVFLSCAALVLSAAQANAAQTIATAQAGGDGDSNDGDPNDPSANAEQIIENEFGLQSYAASASTNGGGVSASGVWDGNPPTPAITQGATGRIAETIVFEAPLPASDVTIRVGIGGDLSTTSVGFGSTSASVQVILADGLCSAGKSRNSVSGPFGGGNCGSPTGDFAELTFTPQQLSARNWQVNFEGQAQVDFSNAGNLDLGSAVASGAVWVAITGGGGSGTPAYRFNGPTSTFPVPEPDATLLGVAALAALASLARKRR